LRLQLVRQGRRMLEARIANGNLLQIASELIERLQELGVDRWSWVGLGLC
jgi:hypothetical protein